MVRDALQATLRIATLLAPAALLTASPDGARPIAAAPRNGETP